jgi:aspartyl-tRNA(Asn)/glutamyl-tRNA(Gln) amidotransferase subunit A
MNKKFSEISKEIKEDKNSCEEIVKTFLSNIETRKELNAFLDIYKDESFKRAKEVDEKIKNGKSGKLAGMVMAIKDIICIKGKRNTCGSKILENFIAPYNATVIDKLEKEDVIIIGKTNLDEFAMGSSTENSYFGPSKNPIDPERVPGGSSGGSAVAVKSQMCTTALGTDTGGSIRQPAAFCGTVGLKPTYGRVSRFGLVAFASSLDQIGTFANNIEDCARVLNVIAGHDKRDSTSINISVPDYVENLNKGVKGLKVGLPKEYFVEGLDKEIKNKINELVEEFKKAGAIVEETSLPHTEYAIATYYIVATAEASSNLARYDSARYGYRAKNANNLIDMYETSRSEGFGNEVKRRIMLGTYVLSAGYYDAYYKKAQQVRRLIKEDFDKVFQKYDCLITPTTPTVAFRIGEKVDDPLSMYLSDIYTVSVNLAGIPGLNVPYGISKEGLPIGVQILVKHFGEEMCLRVGAWIESLGD